MSIDSNLVGVILMGGKSSRMGTDKSQLRINGMSLTDLAHSKLKCYVNEVYYSINKEQQNLDLDNAVLDEFEEEGPLSGIISALKHTQSSILVLGVDMPLITKQSIKTLISHRNWDLLTTTYYTNETNMWEPMLSIWELETLPCLEEYFDNGGRSMQIFLNQFGNQRVAIINPEEFLNVNTIEEFEKLTLPS